MCEKQCLRLGLTCIALDAAFKRVVVVCVILVTLALHSILTGLPIQSDNDQSTKGDEKGRDHTK